MAAPGTFAVRGPDASAGAAGAFVDAYQRQRGLSIQEDQAAIQQILAQQLYMARARQMAEAESRRRTLAAIMAAPDEPLTMAPATTAPGPIIAPGTPPAILQDPGGLSEFGAPRSLASTGMAPEEALAVPQPPALAGAPELVVPSTAATRGPDVQIPAVTEQAPTLSGLRKTLASDPAALAQLASPEAERALKTRGVLSDDEIRYRQSLANTEREADSLATEAREVLDRARKGDVSDGDVVQLAVKQAGYYQRVAQMLARRNPEQAAQARRLSEQLFLRAVELQRADTEERRLAPADLSSFAKVLGKFNAQGGQSRENLQAIFEAVSGFKSKWGRAEAQNLLKHSLDNAIKRVDDQRFQPFFLALLAAQRGQAAQGALDPEKAFQEAASLYPEQALAMLADGGKFGEFARRVAFPNRRVSQHAFQQTLDAVKAEAKARGEVLGDLEAIKRAHAITKDNPSLARREHGREAWARYRDSREKLREELRIVNGDLGRLQSEQRAAASGRGDRDPAEIAKEVRVKRQERDGLLTRLKDLQPPKGSPGAGEAEAPMGDEDEPDHEDEAAPAAPATPAAPSAAAPKTRPPARAPVAPPAPGTVFDRLPDPAPLKGKTIRGQQSGKRFRSDGKTWMPVP